MSLILQHLRSNAAGVVPLASQLLVGQIAINLQDKKLFTKTPDGGVISLGVAPVDLKTVAFSGSWNDLLDRPNVQAEYTLPTASASTLGGVKIGSGLTMTSGMLSANVTSVNGRTGLVTLTTTDVGLAADFVDANGKVKLAYLPDSLVGAVTFKSTWNAANNTPAIPAAATGNKGWYYVVGTAGSTNIDGISSWNVGDWVISDGTAWSKIASASSQVLSVNGQTGTTVVNAANLPGLATVGRTGAYSDLTGIPSTFTPQDHTHEVVDILGLATVATSGSYTDLINLPPDATIAQIGLNVKGTPALVESEFFVFSRNATFPANLVGSQCIVTVSSGTSASIVIKKNGTQVGTITTNSSGIGTFSTSGVQVLFSAGDVLEYQWTSANITRATITLKGNWTN